MGDVVDITSRFAVPHVSGPAICAGCRHSWIAVMPVPLRYDLECPSCHTARGVPQLNTGFESGELRLTCDCGWQVFEISKDTVLCIACGTQMSHAEAFT